MRPLVERPLISRGVVVFLFGAVAGCFIATASTYYALYLVGDQRVIEFVRAPAGPVAQPADRRLLEYLPLNSPSSTLAVATIAVYIAWQQYKTARNKLKLDLFDRRFRVYQAQQLFAYSCAKIQSLDQDSYDKLQALLPDAVFLFDADICDYLKELQMHASRLQLLRMQIGSAETQEQRGVFVDQQTPILQWVINESIHSEQRFLRYLSFKKVL